MVRQGTFEIALFSGLWGSLLTIATDASTLVVVIVGIAVALAVFSAYFLSAGRYISPVLRRFADDRGLEVRAGRLEPVSPILDQRLSEGFGVASGGLAPGFRGELSLFDFVRPSRYAGSLLVSSITRGVIPESKATELIAVAGRVDGVSPHLEICLCETRRGSRLLDAVDEAVRGLERVTLESDELDQLVEIFVSRDQDPVWVRRLLSPAFQEWIVDAARDGFAWEIVDDWVVVTVPRASDVRSQDLVVELERACARAAEVTLRVSEEVAQTSTS